MRSTFIPSYWRDSWKDSAHLLAWDLLNLIVLVRSRVLEQWLALVWLTGGSGMASKQCPGVVPALALWVCGSCHQPIITMAISTFSMTTIDLWRALCVHRGNIPIQRYCHTMPRVVLHENARFSVCVESAGEFMFPLPESCFWCSVLTLPVGWAVSQPHHDGLLLGAGGRSAVVSPPGQVEPDRSSRSCPLSIASPCWGQVETERVCVLLLLVCCVF